MGEPRCRISSRPGKWPRTGVHGANRLASNSLLEGLVFGARAAMAMQEAARAGRAGGSRRAPPMDVGAAGPAALPTAAQVQDLMWQHVGLSRAEAGLRRGRARLEEWSRG